MVSDRGPPISIITLTLRKQVVKGYNLDSRCCTTGTQRWRKNMFALLSAYFSYFTVLSSSPHTKLLLTKPVLISSGRLEKQRSRLLGHQERWKINSCSVADGQCLKLTLSPFIIRDGGWVSDKFFQGSVVSFSLCSHLCIIQAIWN